MDFALTGLLDWQNNIDGIIFFFPVVKYCQDFLPFSFFSPPVSFSFILA